MDHKVILSASSETITLWWQAGSMLCSSSCLFQTSYFGDSMGELALSWAGSKEQVLDHQSTEAAEPIPSPACDHCQQIDPEEGEEWDPSALGAHDK